MILVAGGSGRLGTLVVGRLAALGVDVRVLTRDRARAAHLEGVAAEIVIGDVRDPDTLVGAVAAVDTIVSAVQGFDGPGRVSPASVDQAGNINLIDAAAGVGADVVLVSTVGAGPDSPMELFRAKYEAEQHLKASSVRWTIVRASAFAELWADIMVKPIVFGKGDNPINFVSVTDVAAVVERAALDPASRGHTLEVGGPDDLTFNELAGILGGARGDDGKVRHVPRWVLRVTAPTSRRSRAALTMDTADMRFDARPARVGAADVPMSDIRGA